jgi:predicted PurR-regulated permease PerM
MTGKPDLEIAGTVAGVVVRIGVLLALVAWCFWLLRPFLVPIVWGGIIAVALHPLFARLRRLLGGRGVLAATLLTLVTLVVLALPVAWLTSALVQNVVALAAYLAEGRITVPEPPPGLEELPLIGEPAARFWQLATVNVGEALGKVSPQLRVVGSWLLALVANAAATVLMFVVAIIVAGLLLARVAQTRDLVVTAAIRLVGERGPPLVAIAETTVRNVARGVIGTALLQAVLAGIGFAAVGLPFAAVLALVVFIAGVIQIGGMVVIVPAAIYVALNTDPTTAVLYGIWSVIAGYSDNVLRPILMSAGGQVPLVVVLLGVLGGLLLHGLIGLFVGPIVLALGWELLRAWLRGPSAAGPAVVAVRAEG